MRSVESRRPIDPFTSSPANRITAIRDEYSEADRNKRKFMWDATQQNNDQVVDSIVKITDERHSPTQALNLGAWYTTGVLDSLTLHGAVAEFPAGHAISRHMAEYLAECLTPAMNPRNPDARKLADWLDRFPITAASTQLNSAEVGKSLKIIADEMRYYSRSFELKMPTPAWKLGRFTNPQT